MNSRMRKLIRIGSEIMLEFILTIGSTLAISSSGVAVVVPTAIMSVGETGTSIVATNDNQVWNAEVFMDYRLDPSHGSCYIFEDFSLEGTCATWERDPDDDYALNGIYNDLTGFPVVRN